MIDVSILFQGFSEKQTQISISLHNEGSERIEVTLKHEDIMAFQIVADSKEVLLRTLCDMVLLKSDP